MKYDEKHISIQPTRYENENILIAAMLTSRRRVSLSLINSGATNGPASNIKRNDIIETIIVDIRTLIKISFILRTFPAP